MSEKTKNRENPNSDYLSTRHAEEEGFHDWRARNSQKRISSLAYDISFVEPVRHYFFGLTKSLTGQQALELGCGKGQITIPLAQQGIVVEATDISEEMLEVTRENASENGLSDRICCRKMSAEYLDYPDNTFAAIIGSGVLHHIDLPLAAREMHRVLIPGGRGIFMEPLGHNPALNLYRKLTPKQRTSGERPLRFSSIRYLEKQFANLYHREFHFLTFWPLLAHRLIGNKYHFRQAIAKWTRRDDWVSRHFPPLRRFYWITVLEFAKSDSSSEHLGLKEG